MNQRNYNKLYLNRNRENGSDRIFLGYQYSENEILLHKDKETFFHVPLYTTSIRLVDTDLIANGAVGGLFPAASDRIFKSLKGYGDVTPNGNPSSENGLWFCSWLKKDTITGAYQWMDRFYQPGKFDYNTAVNQLFDTPEYVEKNPVFIDLPSNMVFEPGVLYKYFHLGEKTANELLTTFEGENSTRLKMHLLNWENENIDRSSNNWKVSIKTTNTPTTNPSFVLEEQNTNVIFSPAINDGTRIFNSSINFENPFSINAKVEYDKTYLSENEFTWSFWAYSKDWQLSPSTQLIGNLSTRGGGVGVFLETLETFPVIVVPETKYGHVLMFNEKGSVFLDKSVQSRGETFVSPNCFGIDSNNNIIVCNSDSSGLIYKMDHTGYVIKSTKNQTDLTTLFNFPLSGEKPKQLLCGLNDEFYVITNRAVHRFDSNFILKSSTGIQTDENTVAAFKYDVDLGTVNLDIVNNVHDVKYLENTKWSISASDGHLYKNDTLFKKFDNTATNLTISPDEKYLWITSGTNEVFVIDIKTGDLSNYFKIGSSVLKNNALSRKKNISFIKTYDKKTNKKRWNVVLYYSDEKILYFYTTDGKLVRTIDLRTTFNASVVERLSQNLDQVEFLSNGDFTGYERQRIFSKLPPYSNAAQVVVKASTKDTSKANLIYSSPIQAFGSIKDWEKDSWKHFALVCQNKKLVLYCNGTKIVELNIPGSYQLNFETQPSLFIGSPTGNMVGFNNEIGYTSNIFNGKIGDIRIYDYAITQGNIAMFEYASTVSQDLLWPLPIPSTQYVEQIERMFKHKLPGSKSSFFKLKLLGTQITDSSVRALVENEIQEFIKEFKPVYTDLIKIEWID